MTYGPTKYIVKIFILKYKIKKFKNLQKKISRQFLIIEVSLLKQT